MAEYIRVTVANALDDVYVTKALAGADLWCRFEVQFVAGLPPTNDYFGYMQTFDGNSLLDGGSGVWLFNDAGTVKWNTDFSSNGPFGSITTGVWYTVDHRWVPGSPADEEIWVDDVDLGETPAGNNPNVTDGVSFGYLFPDGWETNTELWLRNLKVGTTRGASDVWAADLTGGDLNAIFDTVYAGAGQSISIVSTGTQTTRAMRHRWRFLLADLDGTPISFWDVQARNRRIEYTLNGITSISGEIDSGNPQANLTFTDGFPYLSEGDRLLYAFRRDYDGGGSTYPWTCRAAGTILEVNDTGDVDKAVTEFVAYDPWQYLMSLPVVGVPTSVSEEGTVDVTFTLPLDEIVVTLLQDAHDTYSFANPAKTGIDLAGGTIESLPTVTMTFQRETSIGDCLQQCASQGCDIVLTPVYDPTRPGVVCDLNVYAWAGDLRPDATFAWDKGRRSVVNDNRQIDGTQRQNNIRYHLRAEADGSEGTVTETEPASIARFGDYWGTRYWPAADELAVITELAQQELSEFSENKRTVSLGPVPERSPDPFTEWYLGDFVKVFASNKLRATQSGYQRVTGFTVEISDDALETVRDLRVYIPLEPAS